MIHSIDWKIVIIDDEEDIRQVISIVLSDAGYEVATAADGAAGIEICKEFSPQIVITDVRMPVMDGIEVLETLKQNSSDIEVIVLTAFGEMDKAARALELDASDYISKPISDDVLFIALKRAQKRYLSKQQIKEYSSHYDNKEITRLPGNGSFSNNVIEGSIDGALACDKDDCIISLNSSILKLLDYNEDEVLHKMKLGQLFTVKEKEKLDTELMSEQYGWGKRISLYETFLIDKNGSSIPVQMSATLLMDQKNKIGMICFFKDLRKQMVLCDQWIQLLDQINIGAFTIDSNRRITSFNDSAQTMTGLKEPEVIGKDCREIFSNIHCHGKCPFHEPGQENSDNFSIEITDQDNNRHLITRLSAPLYGSGNRITGCLTILQDHAALADLINRVNYKERSLKTILDNLDIGIFTVNRGGYTTFFNTAAEVISGLSRRQVLGRTCKTIFGDEKSSEPELIKESMMLGESRSNNECRIVTKQGEVVPIRADYIPLHSDHGKIIGCIATIQDQTLSHQFKQVISNRYTFHSMIGKAPIMQKIFDTVRVVAKSDASILIEGATGTGKDLLAKVIHSSSNRADKPFVKVNCAAIPENLLESELFGYKKGAFTGAVRDKPGRFQEADKGTIFLDEIGDIPLSLQAKFLRVLEDQEFYPLGGRKTIKVDVRIISATNRGLNKLVEEHQFRQDLYYRLNVMHINLPSLKERRDDIPLIISHIVRKLCSTRSIASYDISKDSMKLLLNYHYPGNIRELQNILEHALIVCQGKRIEPEHFPFSLQNQFSAIKDERIIKDQVQQYPSQSSDNRDREIILSTLRKHNWHRAESARALQIDRTTLWRKMKSLGIHPT